MKKFIYLMAMVCTLGFFTACSSDDDNDEKEFVRNEKIEGTWNLQKVEKTDLDNGSYLLSGSVKLTWDCPEGTTLNIKMGDYEMPMDAVAPCARSLELAATCPAPFETSLAAL